MTEIIGKHAIVRTNEAGVFAGIVAALKGDTAEVTEARRLWYWNGAASLSELSQHGVSKPNECKFPCAVPVVFLNGVIEIIPTSEKARKSIEEVPEWRKRS